MCRDKIQIGELEGGAELAEISSEALQLLSQLQSDPSDLTRVITLGRIFYSGGRLGLAAACAARAIEIQPANGHHYNDLLVIYENMLLRANARREVVKEAKIEKSEDSGVNVLVLCAGESTRWNNFMGVRHKHLVSVEGEILLTRTLKQIRSYFLEEIIILVPEGSKQAYEPYCIEGCRLVEVAASTAKSTPAYKYLSSIALWHLGKANISLLGDVWFSDVAIRSIFSYKGDDWVAFGRLGGSNLTRCMYGEIFAHRFSNVCRHSDALMVLDLFYRGKLCKAHASGWALSQIISDEDPNRRTSRERFIEINDFTEDFDFPQDYINWLSARRI